MAQYLPTYVKPPVFTSLPYGLMSVVQLVEDDVDRVHWRNGVQYQPHACEPGLTTVAQCPVVTGFGKFPTTIGVQTIGAQPFTVYSTIRCTPVGNFWEESEERAVAALVRGEARAVENTFWTGAVPVPTGTVIYPHLAANAEVFDSTGEVLLQMPAIEVSLGGPLDMIQGLGLLENDLYECYGGIGVLHAPRSAMTSMFANRLVEKVGTRIVTRGGTPVAFSSSYIGTGPDGSAPAANSTWIYGTGAIFLRRSEIVITSSRPEALNRQINTLQLFAERTYVIGWDCCLFAVEVSLT